MEIANKNLQEKISKLEKANVDFLQRLLRVCMYKENETAGHIRRVGQISSFLAGELDVSHQEVDLIGLAAQMHDIGKVGIPDSILYKPDELTQSEYEVMKTHTTNRRQYFY
ncbi:MAG: HD domain-containing protein [Desulfobacteraceae bacterium]|nr:HD domain-containing protein [Desulfobacteraceae bacterium]